MALALVSIKYPFLTEDDARRVSKRLVKINVQKHIEMLLLIFVIKNTHPRILPSLNSNFTIHTVLSSFILFI